jgi:hypothetical protein
MRSVFFMEYSMIEQRLANPDSIWTGFAGFCLERAADYEQKAQRAVDPAARENFLEAAAQWRRTAEIRQAMNLLSADASKEKRDSAHLETNSVGAPNQGTSFARRVFGTLWSSWHGLNRTPG